MYRDNYGNEITFEEYRELLDAPEPGLVYEPEPEEETEKSYYSPELVAKWHKRVIKKTNKKGGE